MGGPWIGPEETPVALEEGAAGERARTGELNCGGHLAASHRAGNVHLEPSVGKHTQAQGDRYRPRPAKWGKSHPNIQQEGSRVAICPPCGYFAVRTTYVPHAPTQLSKTTC